MQVYFAPGTFANAPLVYQLLFRRVTVTDDMFYPGVFNGSGLAGMCVFRRLRGGWPALYLLLQRYLLALPVFELFSHCSYI